MPVVLAIGLLRYSNILVLTLLGPYLKSLLLMLCSKFCYSIFYDYYIEMITVYEEIHYCLSIFKQQIIVTTFCIKNSTWHLVGKVTVVEWEVI